MKTIDLNENWFYGHTDEEDSFRISIPHDAMLHESRSSKSLGGNNSSWFEGRDYWYEKVFVADEAMLAGEVIIEFEGVYHHSEVYLNGKAIGGWAYGYTGFFLNLTQHLIPGGNRLRVIARNADQPNSRWYSGAGIYRPVKLHILPEQHILMNGIKISTKDYREGIINLQIKTNSSGPARIEICYKDTIVLTDSVELSEMNFLTYKIPEHKLWSPETPELYVCRVVFGNDTRAERFGIRSIECNSTNGMTLNGKRIILQGACVHHDNGLLGACAYDFAEKRKVQLLKNAGYNALRSAHNPCSKALLEACDEYGMLVMDEFTDCWYIHKTKYDYVNDFEQYWRKDLSAMVDKDFNHPSVIMYSTGNEVSETAQPRGIELTRLMTDYLHSIDRSRPVTCGVNIFFNLLSSLGFGVYSDVKADQAVTKAQENANGVSNAPVGSEFYNKLAGLLGDKVMKLGATIFACDIKTRGAFANMDIAGYNYGIMRYRKDIKKYPNRVILGTETFCKDAAAFMELAKKHPAIIGDFVWAGQDYLGEVAIGAHEYADYAKTFTPGLGWISAGSGRIDLTGKELAEAAYTKVAFGIDPIHIAVAPVNNYGRKHSPSAWKMTNAICSWSWNGFENHKTRVEVYARAYEVVLYINSQEVGRKRVNKSLRTYLKVKYMPGEIKAVSYDKSGQELASEVLRTAEDKTILAITPEAEVLRTNELIYLRCQFTDKNGVLKPLARDIVKIEVKGGELLAFGHACPYNEDGYLHDWSDTYYGEALAIIKPYDSQVKIHANSKYGKADKTITII